jgi:hypothetical protein
MILLLRTMTTPRTTLLFPQDEGENPELAIFYQIPWPKIYIGHCSAVLPTRMKMMRYGRKWRVIEKLPPVYVAQLVICMSARMKTKHNSNSNNNKTDSHVSALQYY